MTQMGYKEGPSLSMTISISISMSMTQYDVKREMPWRRANMTLKKGGTCKCFDIQPRSGS